MNPLVRANNAVERSRWAPLLRGLAGALLGSSLVWAWQRGEWLIVVMDVLALTWLIGSQVKGLRRPKIRCQLCGEKPAWCYSLIPPPNFGDRALDRFVMPDWTVWAACDAHDERVREVIEVGLDQARTACTEHDHSGLKLYGVAAADYGLRTR